MDLKLILESILFNSQKPLTPQELRELLVKAAETSEDEAARSLKKIRNDAIEESLNQLEAEVRGSGRSFELVCVAGCWQFVSKPDYAPWLKTLIGERSRPPRLSQPGLETLAIIAYRQPMTRSEIEQIRGVAVDGVMQTLLERGLVEAVGRAEVVGRPVTYGTTEAFLEYFGLRSLQELPAADELRRIPVTKPPALVTAEPQAAAPVEQLSLEQVEGGAAADPAPAEDPAPPADPASTSDPASPAS